VRRTGRAILALVLSGGGIPTVIFAATAAAHVPTVPAAGACSANLASPDQQGPYTADYFSPKFDWAPRAPNPVTIYVAAYAPKGDTQAPTITDENVLYGDQLSIPRNGGSWSVGANPKQVTINLALKSRGEG